MFTLFDQDRITELTIRDAVNETVNEAVSEAVTEARADERTKNFADMALGMLKKKMHLADIAELTHFAPEEIRKIAAANGLSVV